MSDTFQLTSPRARRNEQHCCTSCGARFEVGHYGDPLETTVQLDVRCPRCQEVHAVTVPRGAEKDVLVELAPGPAPELGGGGGGD